MSISKTTALVALLTLAVSACTTATNETVRPEAVTIGAGNAQASNTVLQMVDPWPEGVDDTKIKSPADVDQYKNEDPTEDGANGVATSTIVN